MLMVAVFLTLLSVASVAIVHLQTMFGAQRPADPGCCDVPGQAI